jgi:glycosyltransferase involved in cell wall biosynthesis
MKHYVILTYGKLPRQSGMLRSREIGKELVRRGVTVTYVVDDYPENHGDLDLPPQARVVFVPQPRSWGQVRARRRILAGLAPAWVHCHDLVWRSVLALAWRGKDLHFLMDWDEPAIFKSWPWWRLVLERVLAWWARGHAEKIVACALYFQEYLRQRYGLESEYIPYGLYMEPPADGPSPFAAPTIVYMGSMHLSWDTDILFEAFALMARRGCKPPIVMVGGLYKDAPWPDFCRTHQLDNVTFAGYLPTAEMSCYLRHAHVLTFPIRPTPLNASRCPSKALAYAQARRPIITSKVGEVAQMLGDRATYVDPTPEAMAAALEKAITAPRPPDVDYQIERLSYAHLVDRLMRLLGWDK